MKNIICLSFIIFLVGCSNLSTSNAEHSEETNTKKEYEEMISEQNEEIESLRDKVKLLKMEIVDYETFGTTIVDILDEEQLVSIAKAQWNYKLQINDKNIEEYNSSEEISLDIDELEVRLVESQPESAILPNELHQKGKIDKFYEQIHVSPLKFKKSAPAGGAVNSLIYKFDLNTTNDENMIIEVADNLKERLGMTKNKTEINVQ